MESSRTSDDRTEWRARLRERLAGLHLTESLRRRAASILVDDFAAMIAGVESGPAARLSRQRPSAIGEASLVGGGRATRERAAQLNAVLGGWNELDEGYRRAGCHGGLYTVPSAMAEAEAEGLSVDDVLTGIVAGYEVVATVARHLLPNLSQTIHPHSHLAPIGAASTITWLRTRDADAVIKSAEVAAALAPHGSYRLAREGVLARNLWAGTGASAGFLAADAAAAGILSDARVLSDLTLESSEGDERWAVEDGYHKAYAACQYAHAAIEAASLLAGTTDVAQIREVIVETHPFALTLSNTAPTTDLGCKFSVPHVVAAVLATGRTDADVFGESLLRDSAVMDLRTRVTLSPYTPLPAYPLDRPARVSLVLEDGSTRSAECLSARGGPDRPLSEHDLLAKIEAITAHRAPNFGAESRLLVTNAVPGDTPWGELMERMLDDGTGAAQ